MAEMTLERRKLLEKRLADLEQAQFDLAIGGNVRTFVDQNGERIEYSAANSGQITKLIYLLKVELGTVGGPAETWLG